mgnify:CR=1 FL=1
MGIDYGDDSEAASADDYGDGDRSDHGDRSPDHPPIPREPAQRRGSARAKANWERVRIKLDALHALMRFQRTLRKRHGVHDYFLSRLRDAFFIVNHDDIVNLKKILMGRFFRRRKKKSPTINDQVLWRLAEKHVERRYLENYAYFAHRVRRSIPPPDVLEAELRKVVDLFANCQDAATGMCLLCSLDTSTPCVQASSCSRRAPGVSSSRPSNTSARAACQTQSPCLPVSMLLL